MRLMNLVALATLFAAAPLYAANFGGVGIDGVPLENGEILIRQLVVGGPAHEAGLKPGDVIIEIDKTPTAGSNFKDVIDHHLRGEAGTAVTLSIRRQPRANPLVFTLTRRSLIVGNDPNHR